MVRLASIAVLFTLLSMVGGCIDAQCLPSCDVATFIDSCSQGAFSECVQTDPPCAGGRILSSQCASGCNHAGTACQGSPIDAGTDAGADAGSAGNVGEPCEADGGCLSGAYCWGFSSVCVQDGTCASAGVTMPIPGLCTCDGYAATTCDAGQTCPPAAHGHATYCQ